MQYIRLMLLDFSVTNFRCFADEAHLDLIHPSLRTLTPRAAMSWMDATRRVAAVYGANASGKSTLLTAIECLDDAVGGERGILHQPHRLGDTHADEPTIYRMGFTRADTRYEYTVEAHDWGISREELWAAGTRWRKVFIRTQRPDDVRPRIDTGVTLRGATAEVSRITTADDLFLAVALRYEHETLAPVARALRTATWIHHSDAERQSRLDWVMRQLADGPAWWPEVGAAIAHMADLGITRVELDEREVPQELLGTLRRLLASDETGDAEIPDDLLQSLQRSLVFFHTGSDGTEHRLGLGAQSQGTITWFATVGPAVSALRLGRVLLVDELDASLHPALTATLVEMFKDPDLNPLGAQLVFTTHDTSLLANSPTQLLSPGEVWLCEKGADGTSELFSLADFPDTRKGTNKERRYLLGAYGGVPSTDLSALRQALTADTGED